MCLPSAECRCGAGAVRCRGEGARVSAQLGTAAGWRRMACLGSKHKDGDGTLLWRASAACTVCAYFLLCCAFGATETVAEGFRLLWPSRRPVAHVIVEKDEGGLGLHVQCVPAVHPHWVAERRHFASRGWVAGTTNSKGSGAVVVVVVVVGKVRANVFCNHIVGVRATGAVECDDDDDDDDTMGACACRDASAAGTAFADRLAVLLLLSSPLDYQNRAGNKGAGVAGASEANVDRRERLRKLALETIDVSKVCAGSG